MRLKIDTNNHTVFLRTLVNACTNPKVAKDVQAFIISVVEAAIVEEGNDADITINNKLNPGTFRTGDSKKVVPGYLWKIDITSKSGQKYDGHCYLRTNTDDHFQRLYLEDDATDWAEELVAPTTTLQ